MSGIVRQVEWDRQPPGSISANRGLLGSSLVFAQSAQHVDYDGNQAVEAGALTARPSGVLKEVTSVSYPIQGSVSATQGYTFIHYGVRTGSHSSYYAMLRVLTGGNHIAGFELSETSKHYLFEMSSGGSPNFTGYGTPVTSPLDEEALFIGVVSPGGTTVLYKNGVVVATQASHTSLRSGGTLTIVSAAISTQVALFQGVLLRAMAPAEVFAIASNPRLLFGPAVSHVPFASGGATDYPVTATDALTLAASASQSFAATGVAADAMTLADSASNVAALGAAGSAALTLADSASNVAALSATATDALTLADTLNATASGDYTAIGSDALTLADAASNVAVLSATASDALTLADAASNVAALGAAASDALTLADTLNASASGDYVVVATDALSLSDSVVAAYAAICIATDALTLADATSAAMAGQYAATATDALTLADAASNAAALGVSISEALTLAALVSAMLTGNTALTGKRGGYGVQMQLAARRAQIQTGRRRN